MDHRLIQPERARLSRRTGWALVIAGIAALSAISWAIPRWERILRPLATPDPTAGWVRHQEGFGGDRYIVIRRPIAWKPYVLRECYHYSFPILYLSNTVLEEQIERTENSLSCGGAPLEDDLPRGGVLITWTIDGFPRTSPTVAAAIHEIDGTETIIGGHHAKVRTTSDGCASIGGEREIEVAMDVGAEHVYRVDVCLRGPNIAALERDARNVIASTRFAGVGTR